MTVLDERELTDAERAAIADDPRTGVWIEDLIDVDCGPGGVRAIDVGDGRALTQHETDQLIALEIDTGCWSVVARVDHASTDAQVSTEVGQPELLVAQALELAAITSVVGPVSLGAVEAHRQRGGIHSDPLVRLLAFRVWGDRDRAWRPRDTRRAVELNRARASARLDAGLEGPERDPQKFEAQLAEKLTEIGEGSAKRGH